MAPRSGVVAVFDEAKGLGTVTADDGRSFPFHCTQIADGSRTIAVGTAVTFEPLARLGEWEAGQITPR